MATATSVTLSTCWTVRERGLARRGSPRAETPLPRGSARHTTLSASPCGWQPLAHARPAPGAGPPFRLFPSHALHDAKEHSPRRAALGQTWLCITTCIGLQSPPMMGEHGPMPPSHFGQMGGPGPFGGGRGRGFGRGGPGDGFRSAFCGAQPIHLETSPGGICRRPCTATNCSRKCGSKTWGRHAPYCNELLQPGQ